MFFGCKSDSNDFIYKEKLTELNENGIIQLKVAFSEKDGQEKKYVQDLMREEVEVLKDLNEQEAVFMLCGSM